MKNIEKTIHKRIDEVLARQLKSSIAGKQLAVDTRRDQPKLPPKKSISTTKSPGVKKPKVKEEIVIIQELRDRLDRMENKTAQDHRELIRAHDYTRELEHQIEIKEKLIKELENSLRNSQEDIQNAERKHASIISKEQQEHEKEVEALRRKLDKKDDKYTQER
jgi:chromosome segregation ATPase